MIQPTHIDLAFPVRGDKLPRDHGYALYGALSRALPEVHGADWLGIQCIPGRLVGPETLDVTSGSFVRLRIPVDRIVTLLPLTGATLEIQGAAIHLGAPQVHVLKPVAALDAQLVVIRLTGGAGHPFSRAAFDERFAAEANRQLSRIGVTGELTLRGRRSLEVGGRRIIGHAVSVSGLSAEHSVILQVHGLGGKRTMGCGLFRPAQVKISIARDVRSAS
ncbi:MAG TPA: type I-MYXAN CRISPR-associated protein Cas6/Cmx6 [Kofleriaceae bacterium]|nr:type I-MYXAN CRISPR-associated protein Cas6/Cmx6 [Kofleriaceae bacterium]